VTRSYFTNLRKGRIENPGYEKMLAIARAMGLPPALWFEDAPGDGTQIVPERGQAFASRVGHLFATIRHPATGEPYTDSEVARLSVGGLTEEDVEGMRTGKIADPTVGQVVVALGVSSACPPPTSWIGARTCRSWTRKRSMPSPTRPPQRYSGRAPDCRRGRNGWCSE
jgi:transcriptional regulator with XRE-family HTH domain